MELLETDSGCFASPLEKGIDFNTKIVLSTIFILPFSALYLMARASETQATTKDQGSLTTKSKGTSLGINKL